MLSSWSNFQSNWISLLSRPHLGTRLTSALKRSTSHTLRIGYCKSSIPSTETQVGCGFSLENFSVQILYFNIDYLSYILIHAHKILFQQKKEVSEALHNIFYLSWKLLIIITHFYYSIWMPGVHNASHEPFHSLECRWWVQMFTFFHTSPFTPSTLFICCRCFQSSFHCVFISFARSIHISHEWQITSMRLHTQLEWVEREREIAAHRVEKRQKKKPDE